MNPVCGFCKGSDSERRFDTVDTRGNEFAIRQCRSCSAYFLAPRPTAAQLAEAYDESYYGTGEEKFDAPIERMIDYFRRRRAGRLAQLVGGSGRALDIGCGNGRFLSFVGEQGDFELHGIEMPGESAQRAAAIPGLNLKIGTLEAGDFEPASVDAVTLFHVFEHLVDPVAALDIIGNILKPGGILMMSFPNIGGFQAQTFQADWFHLDPPRHLFFLDPPAFRRMMADRGFSVLREQHFTMEYNPYGMQQSLLNRLCRKREVLYEHLKGNHDYVRDYSRLNLFLQKAFFMTTFPIFVGVDLLEAACRRGATVEFVMRLEGGDLKLET